MDAPILWILCMHLILHNLLSRYSHQCLNDHLMIYADDVHMRWCFNSTAIDFSALIDLSHILHICSFGFKIIATKSVVLFRAVGRGVVKFIKMRFIRISLGPQILIQDSPFRLPMVTKIAYLDINYRAWQTDTNSRRIQAAQLCILIL